MRFCYNQRLNEKNLPALKTQAKIKARLPQTNEKPRWPKHPEQKTPQRTQAAHRSMTLSKTSFPKAERLRRSEEFGNLIRNSRTIRENGVTLYVSQNKSMPQSRLGILVSRRAMKRAVDRNRAKRVIREFFRTHKEKFSSHFDIIVRVIDSSNLLERNNLGNILNRLFVRAKIIHEKNN